MMCLIILILSDGLRLRQWNLTNGILLIKCELRALAKRRRFIAIRQQLSQLNCHL